MLFINKDGFVLSNRSDAKKALNSRGAERKPLTFFPYISIHDNNKIPPIIYFTRHLILLNVYNFSLIYGFEKKIDFQHIQKKIFVSE